MYTSTTSILNNTNTEISTPSISFSQYGIPSWYGQKVNFKTEIPTEDLSSLEGSGTVSIPVLSSEKTEYDTLVYSIGQTPTVYIRGVLRYTLGNR